MDTNHGRAASVGSNRTYQGGFTLIELSIVLVIVALLIAGLLIGREMENAWCIRKVGADFEAYKAAFVTFKDRYNALPGDMPNASALNLGNNGNGDGYIGYWSSEPPQVWKHLERAGIIKGNSYTGTNTFLGGTYTLGVNMPQSPFNTGGYLITYDIAGVAATPAGTSTGQNNVNMHYFKLVGINPNGAGVSDNIPAQNGGTEKVMTALQAKQIDWKFDDGLPVSGKIIAVPTWADCSASWGNNWVAANQSPLSRPCALWFMLE